MKTALGMAAVLGRFLWSVPFHSRRAELPARPLAAMMQIEAFKDALRAYKLDTSAFPNTGPYLPKDIPPDPWGNPFIYKFPGHYPNEPDILSLGADGQPGGEGINADIVSWKN